MSGPRRFRRDLRHPVSLIAVPARRAFDDRCDFCADLLPWRERIPARAARSAARGPSETVDASSPGGLAATLDRERERAFLFRTLATLRTDIPLFDSVDELEWKGPTDSFAALGVRLDAAVTEKVPRRARDI